MGLVIDPAFRKPGAGINASGVSVPSNPNSAELIGDSEKHGQYQM
jgi:hypothetical protein